MSTEGCLILKFGYTTAQKGIILERKMDVKDSYFVTSHRYTEVISLKKQFPVKSCWCAISKNNALGQKLTKTLVKINLKFVE